GQCNVPAGLSGVSAVAASTTYSLALIGPRKQTIAFAPLPNKTFGDPDFTVSATASSGLPVSFAASGHCTVSRAKVHLTGAGSCTITASQAGNANWRPAPPVAQTFSIAPAPCRVPKVTGKRLPAAKAAIVRRHRRTGKVGHRLLAQAQGRRALAEPQARSRPAAEHEDRPRRQPRPQALGALVLVVAAHPERASAILVASLRDEVEVVVGG